MQGFPNVEINPFIQRVIINILLSSEATLHMTVWKYSRRYLGKLGDVGAAILHADCEGFDRDLGGSREPILHLDNGL